jgi:alkylresorcinol/alkylpyrone synthase
MKIVSAASAFPKYYYPQAAIVSALHRYLGDKLPNPAVLDRLHSRTGVEGRFLALPLEEYADLRTWGQANNAWIRAAEDMGRNAICRAVTKAGIQASDLDALLFVSITGIASPSIDARLINRMKLSTRIKRMPIFGLGCVGGAAGISRAADYVKAWPNHVAALLSVEACSLTFQPDDVSVANLISTGLFGDGSACVVVAGSDCDLPGVEIVATRSTFYPDTQEVMGWDISEKGFHIVLSPDVPKVARERLGADIDGFLADHGLSRSDIGSWIIHTGGPKVLEAVQEALGVDRRALSASWDSLRKYGNLSSASVLTVLDEVMTHRRPAAGTWSVLAAMGPGFCSELVLLRW